MARRTFRRREVIAGGIGGGLAVVCGAALGTSLVTSYQDLHRDTVGDLSFANPLAIPPVLAGVGMSGGSYHWDLDLQTGTTEILPGKMTSTWGANGAFLAPTLRASRGQSITANVRNNLPEATTIHWHGMHLPAAMDGGPHQMVQPGESWSPTWEIDQPASTLWYHPHPNGETLRHVYRGIAGMIILDDDVSLSAGLPSTYGVDDVPLILQDKLFNGDGEFKDSVSRITSAIGASSTGLTGDTILINGTYNPHFDVETEFVRLRVLNGSNARSYALEFSDHRAFHVIAAENGLLVEPLRLERLQISPGERAEIVVAFTPGEVVVLRSIEPDLAASFINRRWWGGDDRLDLIEFRAAAALTRSGVLPASIAVDSAIDAIPEPPDVRVRSLTFRDHNNINNHEFDMSRIDEVVAAGATEIWEIDGTGTMHTFHLHGASFRVLEVGGDAPPDYATGLKDTVFIPPDKKVRVLIRFRDYIDASTPYMYHCHLLRHEDRGMMGQFVVVKPGTEDSTPTELLNVLGEHRGH